MSYSSAYSQSFTNYDSIVFLSSLDDSEDSQSVYSEKSVPKITQDDSVLNSKSAVSDRIEFVTIPFGEVPYCTIAAPEDAVEEQNGAYVPSQSGCEEMLRDEEDFFNFEGVFDDHDVPKNKPVSKGIQDDLILCLSRNNSTCDEDDDSVFDRSVKRLRIECVDLVDERSVTPDGRVAEVPVAEPECAEVPVDASCEAPFECVEFVTIPFGDEPHRAVAEPECEDDPSSECSDSDSWSISSSCCITLYTSSELRVLYPEMYV